jgi:4-nitrophenyl phosphatase
MMSKQFRLALLDLDGTLWRGGEVIPGAPEFVERLRRQGTQPVFFTNNSSRTPEEVVDALHRCRIDAEASEVCTSAQAAANVVGQSSEGGSIVTFVGGRGLEVALQEAGMDARRAQGKAIREPWVQEAVAAVVGIDPAVTYTDLALVARVAYRVGSFVLTNPDVRLVVEDGFMPGNGALGALVATASGTTPVVTGKPDAAFVDFALQRYAATPEETVIIGDNLYTDILAGNNAGIYSILVRTGVSFPKREDEPSPDVVTDSVEKIFRHDA